MERPTVSAFGKKPGSAGSRPSFGVARPMGGGGKKAEDSSEAPVAPEPAGGEQFPAIDSVELPGTPAPKKEQDAMSRLTDRAAALNEAPAEVEGFEASVHKIKEQVLPRLLERVDPEAAATLN